MKMGPRLYDQHPPWVWAPPLARATLLHTSADVRRTDRRAFFIPTSWDVDMQIRLTVREKGVALHPPPHGVVGG
jgi:hypothetical protein